MLSFDDYHEHSEQTAASTNVHMMASTLTTDTSEASVLTGLDMVNALRSQGFTFTCGADASEGHTAFQYFPPSNRTHDDKHRDEHFKFHSSDHLDQHLLDHPAAKKHTHDYDHSDNQHIFNDNPHKHYDTRPLREPQP